MQNIVNLHTLAVACSIFLGGLVAPAPLAPHELPCETSKTQQ